MRPTVIGITGSVGKTSAQEAISAVMRSVYRMRQSPANIESRFAIPLAILGAWNESDLNTVRDKTSKNARRAGKIIFLCKVILQTIIKMPFINRAKYPQVLVLEYGVVKPGNIKELLEIAHPDIGIVTAIGEIPEHVEFFSSPEALVREKAKLLESLPAHAVAIVNFDNENAMQCRARTRAKTITFGFAEGADMRITSFENRSEHEIPQGISFKLEYGGSVVPVTLPKALGKGRAYSAAIAACVGIVFNLHLVKVAGALEANYAAIKGSMSLIKGIKETHIIDDSNTASPTSMEEALHSLRDLPGRRKIAVLGDMLELGKYTIEAHEDIGRITSKVVDILVTVGPRAKFIAEAAKRGGLAKTKILSFDTSREAGKALQEVMRKGDLVLVKASRAMSLDQVIDEVRFAE